MTQPTPPPPATVATLSFPDLLQLGWRILQLDERAIDTARGAGVTLPLALSIAAIGGAAGGLTGGIFSIVLGAVFAVAGLTIGVGIAHLLARAFGGTGDFEELLKVMAVASLVKWTTVVPVLGYFFHLAASIWFAVVMVVALRRLHGLTTGAAVLVMLVPTILVLGGSMLLFLGLFLGALTFS